MEVDPYEARLFQMFTNYDKEGKGLNLQNLRQLCEKLELHDKGEFVLADLLETKLPITYELFKESLLNFLNGGGGHVGTSSATECLSKNFKTNQELNCQRTLVLNDETNNTSLESPADASDREVSPKLVMGSKKYGRRSRPPYRCSKETLLSDSDEDSILVDSSRQLSKAVERSSSQTDITSNQNWRTTEQCGAKVKRCASLPAQRNLQNQAQIEAGNKIKFFSKHKSTKTAIQKTILKAIDDLTDKQIDSSVESLETSTHMETLPIQSIIDIWERASIPNGQNILIALGFDEPEICLSHLYKVIEEEVRSLEEEQAMTLLRASSALQTAELTSVRQLLRQVHDENVKLRADNKEANQRVALMAIEIDERHALLEENSKKEKKTLEQRHANAIRELTAKISNDRENWNNLTAKLEAHIKTFEQEEVRLKTELDFLRKENAELESKQLNLFKENEKLLSKIAELSTQKAENQEILEKLKKNTKAGDECDNVDIDRDHDDELVHIMEKLDALRIENHKLRDKNDELVTEVENLNMELQRYKMEFKKRSSLGASTTMTASYTQNDASLEEMELENIATATKRRGDSPSKTHITEESPRTGKLRKCGNDDDDTSSISEMALNAELQQTKDSTTPEVVKALRNRVDELEKLLKTQNTNNNNDDDKVDHATCIERCKELEASLEQMAATFDDFEKDWQSKINDERQINEELQMKLKTERQICDEQRLFYEEVQQESDKKFTELMEKVREYEDQFNKENRLTPIEERDTLEQQYADIEIELKAEREKNEAQSKEIANLKQDIEVLHNEIENLRLHEFVVSDGNEFSQQVAAMNQQQCDGRHLSPASSPISYLWHQSTIQQPAKLLKENNPTYESASNSATTSPNRHKNCTPPNTLTTSSTSQQACISPIQKPAPKILQNETDDNGASGDCDTTSTASGKSLDSRSVSSTQSEKIGSGNVVTSNDERRSITPASLRDELKRLKFLEMSLKEKIKDLSFQRDGLVMELQQLQEARPVLEKAYARTAHPNLTQRISQLELRNRHLQNVIKQQQQYSESMMQQSWRQYQTEMNDLHGRLDAQVAMITDQGQRLQNADMLVKDLYVENAHLTATVQRLEQQRLRITMMQQQQQQQQHMHQLQGLNTIIPGMP